MTNERSLRFKVSGGSSRKVIKEEDQSYGNTLFFGVCDREEDAIRRQNGSFKRQYSDMGENYHRIHEDKEGKMIDLRLLMLLEYFRELSVRKIEVIRGIFPGIKDDFVGFFKKIGVVLSRSRSRKTRVLTMQRSLSFGTETKLRRFKITTPDVENPPSGGSAGNPPSGAAAGDGGKKPAGSSKK